MARSASTMIKDLEKVIRPRGWYLHRHGAHLIYRHPNGGQVVVNGSRVSGQSHTLKKVLADFRRAELGIGARS